MTDRATERAFFMNSLNLVGDGDDVQVLEDVETTFGIRISDAEAEQTSTVGDLFELLCAKVPATRDGTCLAGIAFRRLRDALPEGPVGLRPSMPIAGVRGGLSDRDWYREMHERSGLELNVTELHPALKVPFVLLVFVPPFAVPLAWPSAGPWALCGFLAWLLLPLFSLVPPGLPVEIATVGDLLRRAMGRNYSRLAASAGPGNTADLWLALCGVIRDATGHKGRIDRSTTFFRGEWDR